jgi:alpha-L-fucosidase
MLSTSLRASLVVALSGIMTSPLPVARAADADIAKRVEEVKNLKFGMFVCWSFSTFSDREWTPGIKDVSYFNPTGCDTDQWASVAKEAGMGCILFLTKHHDGFCLWDTKTTDRKVTKSPLGKDVLAEVRQSCDKYGLKLALYYSEGDWTWPGAVDGKSGEGGSNPEVKKAQLRELLTQYGPIEFMWFDLAAGPGGLDAQTTKAYVKSLQPACIVGNSAGELQQSENGLPGPVVTPSANYLLRDITMPILSRTLGRWFYTNPGNDNAGMSAEQVFELYQGAMKHGNIFLLDVGPDRSGRLRAFDVATLTKVGAMIRAADADEADIRSK